MKRGDLITIALIMANVVGVGLIMANGQFVKDSPGTSVQTAQPIIVSSTADPTIRPTSTPSPTMVLAINKDVEILNAPVNICGPIASDPAPGPTVERTPTPAPTLEATITPAPTTRAIPTIKPSAARALNYKVAKKHGRKTA